MSEYSGGGTESEGIGIANFGYPLSVGVPILVWFVTRLSVP